MLPPSNALSFSRKCPLGLIPVFKNKLLSLSPLAKSFYEQVNIHFSVIEPLVVAPLEHCSDMHDPTVFMTTYKHKDDQLSLALELFQLLRVSAYGGFSFNSVLY